MHCHWDFDNWNQVCCCTRWKNLWDEKQARYDQLIDNVQDFKKYGPPHPTQLHPVEAVRIASLRLCVTMLLSHKFWTPLPFQLKLIYVFCLQTIILCNIWVLSLRKLWPLVRLQKISGQCTVQKYLKLCRNSMPVMLLKKNSTGGKQHSPCWLWEPTKGRNVSCLQQFQSVASHDTATCFYIGTSCFQVLVQTKMHPEVSQKLSRKQPKLMLLRLKQCKQRVVSNHWHTSGQRRSAKFCEHTWRTGKMNCITEKGLWHVLKSLHGSPQCWVRGTFVPPCLSQITVDNIYDKQFHLQTQDWTLHWSAKWWTTRSGKLNIASETEKMLDIQELQTCFHGHWKTCVSRTWWAQKNRPPPSFQAHSCASVSPSFSCSKMSHDST